MTGVGIKGEASILVNVSLLCGDNDLKYSLIGWRMNLLRECRFLGEVFLEIGLDWMSK